MAEPGLVGMPGYRAAARELSGQLHVDADPLDGDERGQEEGRDRQRVVKGAAAPIVATCDPADPGFARRAEIACERPVRMLEEFVLRQGQEGLQRGVEGDERDPRARGDDDPGGLGIVAEIHLLQAVPDAEAASHDDDAVELSRQFRIEEDCTCHVGQRADGDDRERAGIRVGQTDDRLHGGLGGGATPRPRLLDAVPELDGQLGSSPTVEFAAPCGGVLENGPHAARVDRNA